MKKLIVVMLAAAMLLTMASCGKKAAETAPTEQASVETAPPATEETIPAPTEPEWESATARASYGEVLHKTFAKDTEVKVLGQFKSYYVVEGEELDLLVEERFVRLQSDEAYEPWTGYARWNTGVYDNVYLRGEALAKLNSNKKVEVLDGKGEWLYIRWDDQEGYTMRENINKYPYTRSSDDEGGGGSPAPSGGGGPVDGTGFSFNELSAWNEGWEVTLLGNYYGPEKTDVTGTGTIIASDVEAYVALVQRDDEVKVTSHNDETITLWLGDDVYGELPRWIVRMDGDEEYESWTGYARWNGILYEEYQMRHELTKPGTNAAVTVLDELPDCYVVEYDGQVGYMKLDGLGKYRVSTGGSSDDEGGGSGGSSGGGAGEVWTPPAM